MNFGSSLPAMLAFFVVLANSSRGLVLDNESRTGVAHINETLVLNGHSELHLTGEGDPISGCVVHLNSADAWVFFYAVKPSFVRDHLLPRFRVDG